MLKPNGERFIVILEIMLKTEFAFYVGLLPLALFIVLLLLKNILKSDNTSDQATPTLLDKFFSMPPPAIGFLIISPFFLIYVIKIWLSRGL